MKITRIADVANQRRLLFEVVVTTIKELLMDQDMGVVDRSPPRGFGEGWKETRHSVTEDFGEPFLLGRIMSAINDEQQATVAALVGQLQRRGIAIVEPERAIGPAVAGTALLYDGHERVILYVAGQGIAEWVSNIVADERLIQDFVAMVDDILATTPTKRPERER